MEKENIVRFLISHRLCRLMCGGLRPSETGRKELLGYAPFQGAAQVPVKIMEARSASSAGSTHVPPFRAVTSVSPRQFSEAALKPKSQ